MSGRNRLHVVSLLRKRRERRAQGDLATTKKRLTDAGRRLEKQRRPTYYGQGRDLNTAQLMSLRAQGVVRAEDLAVARAAWAKCEAEMGEAITTLRNATARRKASDELIERRRLANAVIAAKASQSALDELVVMRHTAEANDR